VNTRIIAAIGIAFSVLFVSLGVVRILPWETAGTLTATTIGVVSIILAAERNETRKKDACVPQHPETESKGELLWEESILVTKHSCSYYSFKLKEKEKVAGQISSENYFNVYFLNPRNFTKHGNGEDFKYEYGTEHASKTRINFVPKKPGKYYCVVQNESKADIDVNVSLHRERN
jgi:hypothetical protein